MRKLVAAAILPLLAACTVGPRHEVPETPLPARFDQAGGEATADAAGSTLWAGFGSAELDGLIARALEANTTIAQAAARLAETRALSGLSVYYWFPTVTAAADRQQSLISSDDPFAPPGGLETDVYRAGFDATWEIDLFGSLRNESRAVDRRTEADAASLADAQLSIVAETAQAWFAMIGARERLALRRRQLANLRDNVAILTSRYNAGYSSGLDLAQSEAEMRAVAATVPQAEADLVREEQRLAVLTAWPIETLRAHVSPTASIPELPALVATGTPEEWLKRRPDVRAAERELAASYSDVGDEIAEYFPEGHAARGLRLDLGGPRPDRRRGDRTLVLRSVDHLELSRLRPHPPAREGRGGPSRRRHRALPGNGAAGPRGNRERACGVPGGKPVGDRSSGRVPRPRRKQRGSRASATPSARASILRCSSRSARRSNSRTSTSSPKLAGRPPLRPFTRPSPAIPERTG